MSGTELLYRDEPYLAVCEAKVVAATEAGGLVLDRTVFYAAGGGQPGDTGTIELDDGTRIPVANAAYGEDRTSVVHQLAEPVDAGALVGRTVAAHLDWPRRYAHMRIHTALHLLSVVLPFPVTGGQIGGAEGRLDFDIPEGGLERAEIAERLNQIAAADHKVTTEWITDEEFIANPGLVKTMAVKPPMGTGRVRLVRIGDVDLQPCGGTHVASTAEIGAIAVTKIEKKGRQNRRVRIGFAD